MIKSMTGFGRLAVELPTKNLVIEIKSLNSKQLDLSVKLPYFYREKESEIRNLISERLERGKIELTITIDQKNLTSERIINKTVLKSYLQQLSDLGADFGTQNPDFNLLLQAAVRFPDVISAGMEEIDDSEWKNLLKAIEDVVAKLDKFRIQEGTALEKDLSARINEIIKNLDIIPSFEKNRIERIKERIRENLSAIRDSCQIDENRFEQELIYYIEKIDISEEKVRLRQHCTNFVETLKKNEAVGRKLNFIAQEIGREINTLGSKANDSEIQKIVVVMKDELEKIKEQILNIL